MQVVHVPDIETPRVAASRTADDTAISGKPRPKQGADKMHLERQKAEFHEKLGARAAGIKGCTEGEAGALETRVGRTLPAAYRAFLLWMGVDAGPLLVGSQWSCRYLADIQEYAVELLAENVFPQPLPDDAFVFWMHQGYQFLFFRCAEGDDPPVYYYHEARHKADFEPYAERFSDFISEAITDAASWSTDPSADPE